MSYRNLSLAGAVLAGFALGSILVARADPGAPAACPECVCPECVCPPPPPPSPPCADPDGLSPEARRAVDDALRAKAAIPAPAQQQ